MRPDGPSRAAQVLRGQLLAPADELVTVPHNCTMVRSQRDLGGKLGLVRSDCACGGLHRGDVRARG